MSDLMKQITLKISMVSVLFFIVGQHLFANNPLFHFKKHYFDSIPADTCIINGIRFEFVDNTDMHGLRAVIKNGKIKIIDINNPALKFRVIRYVFSIWRDENKSSVRHYGDLVSYPIFDLLKDADPGDLFYFEDIIIVDPSKEILDNAVKTIIIKKL
jgi:hypothetical protein